MRSIVSKPVNAIWVLDNDSSYRPIVYGTFTTEEAAEKLRDRLIEHGVTSWHLRIQHFDLSELDQTPAIAVQVTVHAPFSGSDEGKAITLQPFPVHGYLRYLRATWESDEVTFLMPAYHVDEEPEESDFERAGRLWRQEFRDEWRTRRDAWKRECGIEDGAKLAAVDTEQVANLKAELAQIKHEQATTGDAGVPSSKEPI